MILTKLPGGRFANLDGDDSFIGPPEPTWDLSGTGGGNNGWDGSTIAGLVSSVVGSLSDMFGSIFGGAGNKQGDTDTSTVEGAGTVYLPQNTKKSSSSAWIWILLAVVAAVVVLLFLRKQKK